MILTTADMITEAYAEMDSLLSELDRQRSRIMSMFGSNFNAVIAFSKEEDFWEVWVERALRFYRETHEGTIANVESIVFKNELVLNRIAMLKGMFPDV